MQPSLYPFRVNCWLLRVKLRISAHVKRFFLIDALSFCILGAMNETPKTPQPLNGAAQQHISSSFMDKDIWIFDLDNTLYPAQCDLFAEISQRMGHFVSDFLDIDYPQARILQREYYLKYGTTLNGMMTCHDMDPHPYLDYVHDIDLSPVAPDVDLNVALEKLPGRKLILTNGSVKHAENVAGKLGILHHFEDIFDIVAADFVPKPERSTYEKFLKRTGIDPQKAAMFEDLAHNLEVPHAVGMATVLVHSPLGLAKDENNEFDGIGADADHIHHTTDHLAGFLNQVLHHGVANG